MGWQAGINIVMKKTFTQYLIESKIQIPQKTFDIIMNATASAYFSDLMRRMRLDGETPGPEFEQHLKDAKAKYGDFEIFELNREAPYLSGNVPFDTKGLPERYRKNLRKDYTIRLRVGPMGSKESTGAYYPMAKGRAGEMVINTLGVGNMDVAVYMPKVIPTHLKKLESVVDHELQHMVQDTALKRLHPSQTGTEDERNSGIEDNDQYLASDEEFLPQITTAAETFRQWVRGKDKKQIQDAFFEYVDPRRKGQVHPFFKAVFERKPHKWKKAVKELHRLIQNKV